MKALRDRLNDYAAAKSLKKSDQRTAILDLMISNRGHHTADELWGFLKKQNPDIGIATVYRTMKLFIDAGIVKELNIDGTARYELAAEGHHDHLVLGAFLPDLRDVVLAERRDCRSSRLHHPLSLKISQYFLFSIHCIFFIMYYIHFSR